jgi:putative ABC transport system permease protein
MTLALPKPGFTDQLQQAATTNQVIDRIRHVPGVTAVSAGALPPDEGMIAVGPVEFGERPGQPTTSMMFPVYDVWPGYFAAAGIRVIEGRDFHWPDIDGAAIVSRELASRFWPGRSAIGARFKIGKGPWRTVVGVAAEVRRMSEDDDSKDYELYYPYDQVSNVMVAARQASTIAANRLIFVRGARPGDLFTPLGRAVHDLDSRVVVSGTTLVAQRFADAIARPRIVFVMMTVFSIFGLVLAAAGLYAVLSYLVAQRQREIGIRFALGARPRDVRRLILGSALTICAVGVVLGFAASAGLVRAMRTLLYEIEPFDPWSLAAVACLMTAAAVLACWRPVGRAMRVDPVTLLRES